MPLLETPSVPPDSKQRDEKARKESSKDQSSDSTGEKAKSGQTDKGATSVAERFKAASGVKGSKEGASEESEKAFDLKGMEEGELEDDGEEEMPGGGGFFDGYSMWRPGMAPRDGTGFPHGQRGRPGDDDEEHLRQLMKKTDFKVSPSLRRLPHPGQIRGAGNLTAIAKLFGLNEPRPQRPPPPSGPGGKLPDIDVGQLKAILSNVHQHPFLPGPPGPPGRPPFLRHAGPPPLNRMPPRCGPPEPK